MDEYKVKITQQANSHLFEIFTYINSKLKEPATALRLLDEFQNGILSLNKLPKRIALIKEEPWKSYGIRRMSIKNFLIYFWISDEVNEVHIIAVIYNKRDQLEQLNQINI